MYYQKITVLVTIDTAPDKLKENLYTPAASFVLAMCQTEAYGPLPTEVKLTNYEERFHTFISIIFVVFPPCIQLHIEPQQRNDNLIFSILLTTITHL